jgi:methionine synthase I (cobalamin-dependent)
LHRSVAGWNHRRTDEEEPMARGLIERLAEGLVLGDGGYLLEMEKRGYVRAGPFTPEVSLTHPEALAELHREFLRAGSEVLQALTFYASEDKLATVGLAGKVDDINRAAVVVARKVAEEGDALVAGNLSLTWAYERGDPSSAAHVRALFDRQLQVQMDAGIDLVICETYTWLGEALIATAAAAATGLPVVTTMSFEKDPHSYEGDGPGECARRLRDVGASVVGINCLRAPAQTLPLMEEVRAAVPDTHVACQPVAFRTSPEQPDFTSFPEFPFQLDPLQLSRAEMADYAVKARDLGVNYIGACCGAVASHIREMGRALGKVPPEEGEWRIDYDRPMSAFEYYRHQR